MSHIRSRWRPVARRPAAGGRVPCRPPNAPTITRKNAWRRLQRAALDAPLLVSAAAAYVGQPGDAAALAGRVMGYAPQLVRDAVQPVIDEVLAQRNQAVVVGVGILLAFSSVIVMPYLWQLLQENVGAGQETPWLRNSVRYGTAFVVLTALYAIAYAWLPDTRQRLGTVVPGAVVGAALWAGAASLLSYTLHSAGKLALVYGSFAGVVATLVFLYASGTTLIFGAEVNGVLRKRLATDPPPAT